MGFNVLLISTNYEIKYEISLLVLLISKNKMEFVFTYYNRYGSGFGKVFYKNNIN